MSVLKGTGGSRRAHRAGGSKAGRSAGCQVPEVPVHFRLARLDSGRGSVLNSVPVSSVLEGVHPLLIIGRDMDMGRGGTTRLMEGTTGAGWKG